MEEMPAVNVDLEENNQESEKQKQNANMKLDCEDKVLLEAEADCYLASRPCDNDVTSLSTSEAHPGDIARDSSVFSETSGDCSGVHTRKEITKQLVQEVKVQDGDLKCSVQPEAQGGNNSACTPCDSDVLNSTSSQLNCPVQGITKQLVQEVKVQDGDLKCSVQPEVQGGDNSACTPCESDVLNSTSSQLNCPVQGSCVALKELKSWHLKSCEKVQQAEEDSRDDDNKGEESKAEKDSRLTFGPSDSNSANSTCSVPSCTEGMKDSCVTLETPRNFSDSKVKETEKQSEKKKSEMQDECFDGGKVLSQLDKGDTLAPEPCGSNLSKLTSFQANNSNAVDDSRMCLDNTHDPLSVEVGKHKVEEEVGNYGEKCGSSSLAPMKEAEEKEEKERDRHCSFIAHRKQAGKEETEREGHGSPSNEPGNHAAGEEESGSEVKDCSLSEPRKMLTEEEGSDIESKHENLKPNHQQLSEDLGSSSSELRDGQAHVKASICSEQCNQTVGDCVPSKDLGKSSFTETSNVIEQEEESEDEKDQEEKCHPNVAKFLRQYIKVGRYVPVSMSKPGDFCMKESDAVLEAPSLVTPLLIKKPDYLLTENTNSEGSQAQKKVLTLGKSGTSAVEYFESAVGKFFIGLGLSRAREVHDREVLKAKRREIWKASGCAQEMIDEYRRLSEEYQKTRNANSTFKFKYKSCKLCDFKTESGLVLEGHLLTPHLTPRRELLCSFCDFTTRDSKAFVFHVEAMHNRQAVVEPPVLNHQCPFCPFETNLKTKAVSHVNRCEKVFNKSGNRQPSYDFRPPGVTAKPITMDNVKNYEQIFSSLGRSVKNSQKGSFASRQNDAPTLAASRGTASLLPKKKGSAPSLNQNRGQKRSRLTLIQPDISLTRAFQVVGDGTELIPLHSESTRQAIAAAQLPSNMENLYTGTSVSVEAHKDTTQPQTSKTPSVTGSATPSVICEICDGFLKDLAQLRSHMYRTHSVGIHRSTLAHRPPLSCQKCHWRFFTDQGLERHLLGAHGMITPNMQYLAKRGRDAGRCPVCGRIYAAKLVAHIREVHQRTTKLATLSYKCTVCGAVFALFEHFESHVRKVHSKDNSSTAGVNGQAVKRTFSSQAFAPTTVKHSFSKQPRMISPSVSISSQPNVAKRPFLSSSLSPATSNPYAAKPFLAPTSGHSSSAMRPSLTGASTAAVVSLISSKQPHLTVPSATTTSQSSSARPSIWAAASTAANPFSTSASAGGSSATKQPSVASTSGHFNSALRPSLTVTSTAATISPISSKQPRLAVPSAPTTSQSSSARLPIWAAASTAGNSYSSSASAGGSNATKQPSVAQTLRPGSAGTNPAKRPALSAPSTPSAEIVGSNPSNQPVVATACIRAAAPTSSTRWPFMPPVSSPVAVHHVAGARPSPITASTLGAARSSSPKQQVLVTFPAPAVSNTIAIPSSGQHNSVKKQATCLPTVQPAKQPYFATVPAAVTKTTHVLAVEPNSKQKEVSGGVLTDPTSKSLVSKIKVEKEATMEAAPPAPLEQSAVRSTGEPNSCMKQGICLPAGQPTKQTLEPQATGPTTVTNTAGIAAVELNSKQKEISEVLTGAVLKSAVSKIKVEREVPVEDSCMKQGIWLPAGQPTTQTLEPQATGPTTVTNTAGVAAVEPNSKQKEISEVLTGAVLKSAVSKIKVEREVPVEAAPSDPLEESEPELGWCVACKESVEDIAEHLKDKHMKRCRVRTCHIEKCDRCLSSFSGLLVVTTLDAEDEDSSEEDEGNDNEKEDGAKLGTTDLDRPCKAEPMDAE